MNRPAVRLHEHEVTPVGLWALRAGAPTVAVVVSLNFPGLTPRHRDLVRRYTRTALQALVDAGTRPILVDSSAAALPDPAVAAAADGLLVLGGGDVDPALHGAEGPVPGQYGVDPRADRYTLELQRHGLDSVDREVRWLAELIDRELDDSRRRRADGADPGDPPAPPGGAPPHP